MSGSKPFTAGTDYPSRGSSASKPMRSFDRTLPSNFTDLRDTIANYIGHAGKYIVVNATEDGLTILSAAAVTAAIAAVIADLDVVEALLAADPFTLGADYDFAQKEAIALRLEQIAGNPATPVNGQLWYNTSTGLPMARIAGANVAFFTAANAASLAAVVIESGTSTSDIVTLTAEVDAIADDDILSMGEKPSIKMQYDNLLAEQSGLDTLATTYGVTTEKTTYDNAITALTAYLGGLTPVYTDFTQDSPITGTTLRTDFKTVYDAKQALINKINAVAFVDIETADTNASAALVIVATKKRHFFVEPTTPYNVGDLWSDGTDFFRCIVERLTGAYVGADWEAATAYDNTQVVIDNGVVTAGRIEVGGGALGANNAGMQGAVSGTPTTDIRFWAGDTFANRATAAFRVQNNGAVYGSSFILTTPTIDGLKIKLVEIVDWNMYVSGGGTGISTKSVAHGLDVTKIRSVSIMVRNDADTSHYTGLNTLIPVNFDGTNVNLICGTTPFDDPTFNDEGGFVRGWITLWYTP